jgi:hypothetical protein
MDKIAAFRLPREASRAGPIMARAPAADPANTCPAPGVDVARYPLLALGSARGRSFLAACRQAFEATGSLSLPGFLAPEAVAAAAGELAPRMAEAHHHSQRHNIYFSKQDPDLPPGHGALARVTTSNLTLACDKLGGTVIRRVYEWPPLCAFLAALLRKPRLYPMADALARLNVMGYRAGDGLNWHFDRAHFSVTLLLQAPRGGGAFEYRPNLRTGSDPNYDGVARLLAGADAEIRTLSLAPGTLNVFAGRYAAHRITPVEGGRMRLVAVMSFTEEPGVVFCAADRIQFYGRAEEIGA